MADSYLWTIDHGVVATKDYPHVYKAATPAKCVKPSNTIARFYNKHSNEEDNTSNEFLKTILAQQPVGAAYNSDLQCMMSY